MTLTFARRHEPLHWVLNDLNTHIFFIKKDDNIEREEQIWSCTQSTCQIVSTPLHVNWKFVEENKIFGCAANIRQ